MYTSNVNMKRYYEQRKKVRKLYKHDTSYSGDLCGSLLEIRDKRKYVEIVSVDLQKFNIGIEFTPGTEEDKKEKVVNKVNKCLKSFIENNINEIEFKNSEERIGTILFPKLYSVSAIISFLKSKIG